MKDGVAAFRANLETELAQLESRCATIKSLLHNLDDYEHSVFAMQSTVAASRVYKPTEYQPAEGPSVMERAKRALETIPQPYVLVDLKRNVEKDGLGDVGRGNWGVVVQKLKKKGLITCCGGEEGKPGALYKNSTAEESAEPSPAGGLF